MTLQSAATMLRFWGCTIRKQDGEYRVNLKGNSEDSAYYTNDIIDAVKTASLIIPQTH